MFEQLLLNVETYPAATLVAQKWMEYPKNFAVWAPLIKYGTQKNQ